MLIFWQRHPALWYGLLILLTTFYFFHSHFFIAIPVIFLLLPYCLNQDYLKIALALVLMSALYLWLNTSIVLPPSHLEPTQGQALLKIESIQQSSSSFGQYSKIRGTLLAFSSDALALKNIPASIVASKLQSTQLVPGHTYAFRGTLSQKPQGYRFKCEAQDVLLIQKPIIPLAKWRSAAKEAMRARITKAVSDQRSANFIAGLATGEFDDRMTQHQLSRFGLQHLLAISGFHFALLTSFLLFFLSLLFKSNWREYCLLVLLALYALYLGNSPSVIRAWIMLCLAIAAPLLGKQSLALNSLGIALLFLIISDPHAVNTLGFQFSCAITASILIFNTPIDRLLEKVYPARKLEQAITLNTWQQYGLIILAHFRKLLALTFSVNLIALPLCLVFFHKFPWMSLPYNLFFPILTAPVLFFLLLGVMVDSVSFFLGEGVHQINGAYTNLLLNLTYNMPETVDAIWITDAFTPEMLGLLFVVVFSLGLFWLRANSDEENEIRSPYLYLG